MSAVFGMVTAMPETGCWIWQRCCNQYGYGILRLNGRNRLAHRIAWTEVNGDPGSLYVCHTCDNPPCCNPAHLFLGTPLDNTRDMIAKGRSRRGQSKFGTLSHNAKITEAEAAEIRTLYATGEWTQYQLGQKYGIDQTSVSRVVRRATWPHVEALVAS